MQLKGGVSEALVIIQYVLHILGMPGKLDF
jgi:hypothetical protein